MKKLAWCLLGLFLLGRGALPETLRVMSFNVRYPNPNDGSNVWENRRDLMVSLIQAREPDLIGTQELYFEQGQFLAQRLPAYRWFGLSRRGDHTDEHMGVFYRTARLELVQSGNFWLSETPEQPGSMSWGVSLPRMVTWGRFRLRSPRLEFYFLNTHFPHRPQDEQARLNCARVIVGFLEKLPPRVPVVLTGDFNAPAGGEVHQLLVALLQDARAVAAGITGPEGTFHGFKGTPQPARIDWILFRAPWRVLEVETITFHKDGRYPSDHFPVLATFDLTGDRASGR